MSAPAERPARVVLETRAVRYPERRFRPRGERKDRVDPGGVGVEIVREAVLCFACAKGRPA